MIFHLLWSFMRVSISNILTLPWWFSDLRFFLGTQNKNISTSFISREHVGSDATNTRSFPTTSQGCGFVPSTFFGKLTKPQMVLLWISKKWVNPGIWRWFFQGQISTTFSSGWSWGLVDWYTASWLLSGSVCDLRIEQAIVIQRVKLFWVGRSSDYQGLMR